MTRTKSIFSLLALLWLHVAQHANAQCTSTVSSFPYSENFESSNGNFTAGGNNSDWTYGTPSKTVITGAASGTRCWIVGGLTGNAYNNAENSWLQFPCFDFSGLTNPQLSFKVFWETEKKYDGASLMYSIDGGTVWAPLGSTGSNTNCNGSNWFNTTSINSLGVDGWSGNIQPTSPCAGGAGNGSGAWVTAKHTLSSLAGKPSVMFRFIFAAGTQCNAYNGFAIDDVQIGEAAPNTANFSFSCSGSNTVSFTNTSSLCGSNFLWNFNDPSSGSNISTNENPSHVFTAPGTYNVSLMVTFPGNNTVTTTKPVTVISVTPVVTNDVQCHGGANGSIVADVLPTSGAYTYSWNTTPVQTTKTINNLVAGNYTVIVSGTNVCPTTASIVLTEPAKLAASIEVTNALCGKTNGRANAFVTGGITPYQYAWSNGGTTNPQANLAAGLYSLTVKDDNNCTANAQATVKDSVKDIALFLGNDTSFCPGNQTILSAGSFANYLWQDNSTAATFTVTQTGKYYVQVADADGCTKSDTILVTVDCSDVYFPTAFTPNGDNRNKLFGPIGNIASITSFTMNVYGRWGELLFSSTNPYHKWDGKFKGIDADDGTYVWFAVYSINNRPKQTQKGTITILR